MDVLIDGQHIPAALTAPREPSSSGVFAPALLGAGLLHLFLMVGISISPPKPPPIPETALEVLIVSAGGATVAKPPDTAALSQRNRLGARSQASPAEPAAHISPAPTDERPSATEPESAPQDPQPSVETPSPGSEAGAPADPPSLLAQPESETFLQALPESLPPMRQPVSAADILASRNREIARLTASLEARSSAYAKRVRRKSISASTKEFRYASYLGAWARKVERIGNLNYPQAAKEQHLYGSLILHVAIRSDGNVENIRVVRSSGYDLLDEAAIQIVQLAAPYSAFPPDIAAETDVLDIIRTWRFMRGDVLGWER